MRALLSTLGKETSCTYALLSTLPGESCAISDKLTMPKKALLAEGFAIESPSTKKSLSKKEPTQTMQQLLESLGMGHATATGAHGFVYEAVHVTLKNHDSGENKACNVHVTFYPASVDVAVTKANWSQLFNDMHVTIKFYGVDDKRNPRCFWQGAEEKWGDWNWGADPRPGNAEQRKQAQTLIKSRVQDDIIKDIKAHL
jgi:hypothetical protein